MPKAFVFKGFRFFIFVKNEKNKKPPFFISKFSVC